MSSQEQKLSLELQIEKLRHDLGKVEAVFPILTKLAENSKELQEYVTNEITKYAASIRHSKLDRDQLESFFHHPYYIYQGKKDKDNEFHLAIPKFVDVQFGWLDKVTESHNVFLINRYVDWLGELPKELKKIVGMKDPLDVFLDTEAGALVGKDISQVTEKYRSFITKAEKDRLIIDKQRHFELLATLIKDGILPFIPKPIPVEELLDRRCDIDLRDYQNEAWVELKRFSNIGAFFPPSAGKTFLGIYAMCKLPGFHIIACPSKLLVEQWIDRIETYTDLKFGVDYFCGTYQACVKYKAPEGVQVGLLVIDETHHLPSNEFSRLAVIKRRFTLGLSATPQREDSREEYIFALTGKPVGLSWQKLKELGIIKNPDLNVWIVKNESDRMKILDNLLISGKKTIIFSDSIDMGKAVSKRYNVPHVYGDTKQRLDKIKDSVCSVVSRVGDEGVSLPDIEQVIEISWLHGSRRQELQRFTRLLHGKNHINGVGHIIMTVSEYQADHKRLYGVMDKGFKIILHRDGIDDKVIEQIKEKSFTPKKPRPVNTKILAEKTNKEKIDDLEEKYPLMKYPAVKKLYSLLNKKHQKGMLFFIDPANQDKAFTIDNFKMAMGLISENKVVKFQNLKPLLDRKIIIESEPGLFKQNFSQRA